VTEPEVRKLIAVMTAALPREWSFLTKEQQKATEAIYVRMLADLPYAAASSAVESLLSTSKSMPTIGEVRIATMRAMHGDVRAGGDAWGDVRRAISRYGMNRAPLFDDPAVERVVRALGWRELCQSENDVSDRARFIELYDRFAREQRHEANVSQLPAAQRLRALQPAQQPQIAAGAQRVNAMRLLEQITDGEKQ
jgi:hypothetical protein